MVQCLAFAGYFVDTRSFLFNFNSQNDTKIYEELSSFQHKSRNRKAIQVPWSSCLMS